MIKETQDPSESGPPRGRFTIVFLIHEAFRRDLDRLRAAVSSPKMDSAKAQRLGTHWEFVKDQLHHHHRVEDESFWPLVRPKFAGRSDELAVLDEMEAQHRALEPTTEAVDRGFEAFLKEPGDRTGAELAAYLAEFRTQLAAHLEDEEQRCFPSVDAVLSVEEFESFGKATAKAVGMRGSARFFPWIFDEAIPVERQAVLSMPPPPVRVLCRYVWEPRYERQVATLWTD